MEDFKGLLACLPLVVLSATLTNLSSVKPVDAAVLGVGAPLSSAGDFTVDVVQNGTLTFTPLSFAVQAGSVSPFSEPSDILSFANVTFPGIGSFFALAANFPVPAAPGSTLTYVAFNSTTGGRATYNISFPVAVPEPSAAWSTLAFFALAGTWLLTQQRKRISHCRNINREHNKLL